MLFGVNPEGETGEVKVLNGISMENKTALLSL